MRVRPTLAVGTWGGRLVEVRVSLGLLHAITACSTFRYRSFSPGNLSEFHVHDRTPPGPHRGNGIEGSHGFREGV